MLRKHREQGLLQPRTKWRRYRDIIRKDPEYLCMETNFAGSRPRELFSDILTELEEAFFKVRGPRSWPRSCCRRGRRGSCSRGRSWPRAAGVPAAAVLAISPRACCALRSCQARPPPDSKSHLHYRTAGWSAGAAHPMMHPGITPSAILCCQILEKSS